MHSQTDIMDMQDEMKVFLITWTSVILREQWLMQTFLVKKGRRPFKNDFHVSIKDKTIAIPASF